MHTDFHREETATQVSFFNYLTTDSWLFLRLKTLQHPWRNSRNDLDFERGKVLQLVGLGDT